MVLIVFLPGLVFGHKSLNYLNRILKANTASVDQNIQRLSSGTQLLTDNPAYFAIYEKLESHLRGMEKYINNNGDMYNYYQFEESVLGSITESLQRIRELSLQLSGGIYGEFEKDIIRSEMRQHYDQILYELNTAQFNRITLFKELFKNPDIQNRFNDPLFYQTGSIDSLLKYFMERRVWLGAMMNRIKHQISAQEKEKENTAAFRSQGDTDYATEMAAFQKNQLLMMVNIMMLNK